MTQTIKEQTRPLEDSYEELNYLYCQGTVCDKMRRNHFKVSFMFLLPFFPPGEIEKCREFTISITGATKVRSAFSTVAAGNLIMRSIVIRAVTAIQRTNRQNRKWSH